MHQCRQCSYPLELDEASKCYRHHNPQDGLLGCGAQQRVSPAEAKRINNKKSHARRKEKKEAKIAKLNSLNAKRGRKLKEKVNGRYRKTSRRMKKLGKRILARTPTNKKHIVK